MIFLSYGIFGCCIKVKLNTGKELMGVPSFYLLWKSSFKI